MAFAALSPSRCRRLRQRAATTRERRLRHRRAPGDASPCARGSSPRLRRQHPVLALEQKGEVARVRIADVQRYLRHAFAALLEQQPRMLQSLSLQEAIYRHAVARAKT